MTALVVPPTQPLSSLRDFPREAPSVLVTPFFNVFNYLDCHQSMTMTFPYATYRKRVFDHLAPTNRVADTAFAMPPFLPDTPAYRKQVARIFNGIAKADQDIGRILAGLETEKLAEDTIIFCYADHGEAIPRGKANPIGLGYRVPFIVVFPEKWRHLNPWGAPGTTTDELICFDELAPTMLSLIARKPEPWMTGRPFLGTHRRPAPPFVFGGRNRIDESAACTRSITDGRYVYSVSVRPNQLCEARERRHAGVNETQLHLAGRSRTAPRAPPMHHAASLSLRQDWSRTVHHPTARRRHRLRAAGV